ncbi:glycosyltransferase [Mesorhizobium sp. B2-7-2]|uniref:glycosyltransferase n=1 Tax=Mesorhizobium sp. B2-7-2 TaxID=2589908 RepID=UPI0015E44C34|nr:glycosyltransferase [Mesorhizobium sp. B2-7-2]
MQHHADPMRYVSLGTYPIRQPVQGGQLRANAIHKVLRDCGWETRHVLVTPNRGARREMEAGDLFIEMPRRFRKQMARRKWRSDVATAEFVARSRSHRLEIARFLDDFRPDVIAVEQCWLWPALREYVETCSPEARFSIVYSSHNVEQQLLAQEAAIAGAGTDLWSARRAADIESDLAANADLVVAVSEQDAAYFRTLNPSVVVAANGVWPRETPVGLDRWASRFAGLRTALFVGSGQSAQRPRFSPDDGSGPWFPLSLGADCGGRRRCRSDPQRSRIPAAPWRGQCPGRVAWHAGRRDP